MNKVMNLYVPYCAGNSLFYQIPDESFFPKENYSVVCHLIPEKEWALEDGEYWTTVHPLNIENSSPDEGWKIHVSSTPDTAERILAIVSKHCFATGAAFKYLRNDFLLRLSNSKYALRSSSGKFVTIYPPSESVFVTLLERLHSGLKGLHGPRVLTDHLVDAAPLSFRYGAFTEQRKILPSGKDALFFATPSGDWVKDSRVPAPSSVSGIDIPTELKSMLASEQLYDSELLPYEINSALHYSNAGGVYKARSLKSGDKVILKEARRYVAPAFDNDVDEASSRLHMEAQVLKALAGTPGIPAFYGLHVIGDNAYLAESLVDGTPLQQWVAKNHPYCHANPYQQQIEAYYVDVVGFYRQIKSFVEKIHEAGYYYGDLHPGNILVSPDKTISLVDFEESGKIESLKQRSIAAPGFTIGSEGKQADYDAADLILLWMLIPSYGIWSICPERIIVDIQEAGNLFQQFSNFRYNKLESRVINYCCEHEVNYGAGRARPYGIDRSNASAEQLKAAIVRGIKDSVNCVKDSLYPHDVGDESTQWNIVGGAAGTLWALSWAAETVNESEIEWLVCAAKRSRRKLAGLYNGYAGVALLLHEHGRQSESDFFFDRVASVENEIFSPSLFGGLSGISLTYLQTGRLERALSVAERLRRHLTQASESSRFDNRAGLLYGWTGASYLFLRLFELTNDEEWSSLAIEALKRDCSALAERGDGTLLLKDNSGRGMPYLANGSAGIYYMLARGRQIFNEKYFCDLRVPLEMSLKPKMMASSSLLEGRAGIMAVADYVSRFKFAEMQTVYKMHLDQLWRDAVEWKSGALFVGRNGTRCSCDLGYGSASVILGLSMNEVAQKDCDLPLPGFVSLCENSH